MKTRQAIFAVSVLAFALALGAMIALNRFAVPERWEDSEVAANILNGLGACRAYLGTTYCFYGSSTYAWILAAAIKLSPHGESVALFLNAVLFAGTCWLVWLAAQPLGKAAASLAALLVAVHPGAIIYTAKLHSQTLDVFLIALTFVMIARTHTHVPLVSAFSAGVIAGLAVLSRGTIASFLPVWALWFLWKNRTKNLMSAAVVVTAVAVGSIITVTPVLLRGYMLYETFVPLRTDSGLNLWLGNHLGATGTPHVSADPPVMATTRMSQQMIDRLAGHNEVEQNRILTDEVIGFVQQHPTEAVRLFAKKLFYFWWFSPHAGLFYPPAWLIAYRAYYLAILCFAAVGLTTALRSSTGAAARLAQLFLILAASLCVTQAVFYVEGRQRWQLELLLLVFTSTGILRMVAPRHLAVSAPLRSERANAIA